MHELTASDVMAALTGGEAEVELQAVIDHIVGPGCRLTGAERLSSSTFRLTVAGGSRPTFVIKRMSHLAAQLNEAARRSWLPSLGLGDHAPPLLGSVPSRHDDLTWCIYADEGNDLRDAGWERLADLVDLVADVHLRAYGHPLVEEVVALSGDRGAPYLSSRLERAMDGLSRLLAESDDRHGPIPAKLADELAGIDVAARTDSIRRFGGQPTLLHGDLWPMNALTHGGEIRLIDWDRAAGGPAAFDLSILVRRIPPPARRPAFERYLERNPILPADHPNSEIEYQFESYEIARIADDIGWLSATIANDPAATWALDDLSNTYDWLTHLGPVFEDGS